ERGAGENPRLPGLARPLDRCDRPERGARGSRGDRARAPRRGARRARAPAARGGRSSAACPTDWPGARDRRGSLLFAAGPRARIAATLMPLVAALRAQLEARDQWRLVASLERPLTPVLLDMERAGVRLDAATLRKMSRQAEDELGTLRTELMAMAGEPVNLDS